MLYVCKGILEQILVYCAMVVVVVLSVNCQVLQTFPKRTGVLNYLKDKNPNILCLQDMHWLLEDQPEIRHLCGEECTVHLNITNSRGVAVPFGSNFQYKIEGIEKHFITKLKNR